MTHPHPSLRAGVVLAAGSWDAETAIDDVLIDFDQRFRRRFLLHTTSGCEILLDLPQAVRLRHGDGLLTEHGSIVRVHARDEALHAISAQTPAALMRIAWHLGNRHLPVQFKNDRIHMRADHVIADMVRGLGGTVAGLDAPFDPEAGAYAGAAHHHHDDHE